MKINRKIRGSNKASYSSVISARANSYARIQSLTKAAATTTNMVAAVVAPTHKPFLGATPSPPRNTPK